MRPWLALTAPLGIRMRWCSNNGFHLFEFPIPPFFVRSSLFSRDFGDNLSTPRKQPDHADNPRELFGVFMSK